MTEESSIDIVLDHEYSSNEKSRENLNRKDMRRRYRLSSNYSSSPNYHRRHHYRRDRQSNRYHNEHDIKQRYENLLDTRKRSKSPQLTEEQRDRRTVFVQQLAARLMEHELELFMERVGKVRKVKIVSDKITGRSRGFGYVEYYEEQSVPLAIMMSGEKLLGIPILVSYTETEKNRLAEEAEAAKRNSLQDLEYRQIQIRNVHSQIKEDGLRVLLNPFGYLESISMRRDTYKANGDVMTWIVQIAFKDHRNAKRAVEQLNGFELAGLKLQVTPVTISRASNIENEAVTILDDSDGVGMAMSSQARTDLMLKLARGTDLVSKVPGVQTSTQEITPYVAIINAYDPDLETDPNWVMVLCEDIREECSKFGNIIHIQVLESKSGEIYIKYDQQASSQVAVASLNGRWFGGRQLIVKSIPFHVFQTRTGHI